MIKKSIHITHDALQAYKDIESATKYIVLHAAFYPKYLTDKNRHQSSIEKALCNNADLQVYIIVTNVENTTSWAGEFGCVLRAEFKDNLKDLETSINFNIKSAKLLQEKYPQQVHLYKSSALPLSPIVIADNVLFVGYYAHSFIPAPEGLWVKIEYSLLTEMFENEMNGTTSIKSLNDEEKAVYRFVEDCIYAIKSEDSLEL